MSAFDRHIFARMAAATGVLLGLLIVFFVVLDYLEYIDDFLDRGATMQQILGDYYLNYVPEIVRLTSPLAVFLAAIYVTGRLAQSLQLTALYAAGVSLYRLLVPYLLFGAMVTAAMFAFNGWVVPRTNAAVFEFQQRYYRNAPETLEAGTVVRQNGPSSVLQVGFFDEGAATGYRVALIDEAGDRVTRRLDATDMTWVDSLGAWRMNAVIEQRFDSTGVTRRELGQRDTVLAVLPRDLARTERDAERLTIPEARAYLESLRRAGADRLGRPLVEYYNKFSYPLANALLILIGVALASVRRRGGQAAQFGLGLFVAFSYLALQKLSEPFGYAEAVPPIVVSWAPHVVFALVGLVLLKRAPK